MREMTALRKGFFECILCTAELLLLIVTDLRSSTRFSPFYHYTAYIPWKHLVVHPPSSGHFWKLGNPELPARLMSPTSTPHIGMFMRVPVGRRLLHRLFDLSPGLEASSFERQRASGFSTRVQSSSSTRRRWAERRTRSRDRPD